MTPPNTVNAERLTSHIASELLDLMKHVPLEHHGTLVAAAAIVEQRHAARAEPHAVDAERLRACPFCAGPGFVRGDKFAAWVQCDKCGTEGPTISDEDSERGAVEAWNRRDTRAEPHAVDAERLREIAAIAHDGGLCGLSEADALIAIRRLSMRSWNISGSGQDRTMRVLSALALQDKAEVSDLRRSWDAALAVDRPPTGEDTAAAQDAGYTAANVDAASFVLSDCSGLSADTIDAMERALLAALAQRPAAPREGVRGSGEAVATVLSLSDRGNELDVDQAALDQLPAGTKLYTRSEDARDGEDAVGHVTARGGIRWTSRAIPRTGTPLYARSEDARDARSEHDA